jgi:predicted TIM-barrel fold metal-dependent hydrolase
MLSPRLEATCVAPGGGSTASSRPMKHVWFDATGVVRPEMASHELEEIAARIRQIGVERVLYGSDAAASPLTYPRAGWAAFRRLPLSEAEFRAIAKNITPYMRDFPAQ